MRSGWLLSSRRINWTCSWITKSSWSMISCLTRFKLNSIWSWIFCLTMVDHFVGFRISDQKELDQGKASDLSGTAGHIQTQNIVHVFATVSGMNAKFCQNGARWDTHSLIWWVCQRCYTISSDVRLNPSVHTTDSSKVLYKRGVWATTEDVFVLFKPISSGFRKFSKKNAKNGLLRVFNTWPFPFK